MHLPEAITDEINTHFGPHFSDRPSDFVCVYGSSVYSPDKVTSDVDLFMVTHGKLGDVALGPMITFIKDMHVRHGRTLDEEVPYENKVHYDTDEAQQALTFGGFAVDGLRIAVPPIIKDVEFLRSPAVKARLFLNALTTPHVAFGNELGAYSALRRRAERSITILAISLVKGDTFDVEGLYGALTVSPEGDQGEMFLGYKTEYPIVVEHLYGILGSVIKDLESEGVIRRNADGNYTKSNAFDPLTLMKASTSTER